MIIEKGPFCECIKTGFYFTLENDDRVFNGDLFYDFGKVQFQARGIAGTQSGEMISVLPKTERGPVAIEAHLLGITGKGHRAFPGKKHTYVDLIFTKAVISGSLAAHIEEWYGDRSVWAMVQKWEIRDNLAWVK